MKSVDEIIKTSISDIHLLTPEEQRIRDLNIFVAHRFLTRNYSAQELKTIWDDMGMDYSLEEIQFMIDKRGTK